MNRRVEGMGGERKAAEYLRKQGYSIVSASYRSRWGEIDIVAQKGRIVAFVEVKQRRDDSMLPAMLAVNAGKQKRIRTTAMQWLAANPGDWQGRFDVIEVYEPSGRIHHIENAFW